MATDQAPLSEQRLSEIEARSDAAGPGPWSASPAGWVDRIPHASINRTAFVEVADAEFVAYARQDVPDLIAEVRRLQREVRLLNLSRGVPNLVGMD